MKHTLCGICTSDLSLPFSCVALYAIMGSTNQYRKGHLDDNVFTESLSFIYDELIDKDIPFTALGFFCATCRKNIAESILFYSCRIKLNEIPLVTSIAQGYTFDILKYRLEHRIESFAPLSIGLLSEVKYKRIYKFLQDRIKNRHFLRNITVINLNNII